jgi:hypothetical protein
MYFPIQFWKLTIEQLQDFTLVKSAKWKEHSNLTVKQISYVSWNDWNREIIL